MSKLIILSGISGSGKSTFAHKEWEKSPKNIVRVNRDKIREMLFGYTEKSVAEYYLRKDVASQEKQVSDYVHELILFSLSRGKNVIVDNTNLKISYIEEFSKYNVETELVLFCTPLEECLKNDLSRHRGVGETVIRKQYKQFQHLLSDLHIKMNLEGLVVHRPNFEFKSKITPYTPTEGKESCIVVDVDGTIADNQGKRSPFDWSKVDQDVVKENVADIVVALRRAGYKLVICTGRDGEAEALTKKWLYENNIPYDGFYIRNKGDMRKDFVVKQEMWDKIKQEYNIVMMFDDRRQVIDHARSLGYTVSDVANHTF